MERRRFVVVGLGNFGASLATTLSDLGHEVLAIDLVSERVDRWGSSLTRAAVGDGMNPSDLKRLGAVGADAAIIGTGDDITASALAMLALRDLGVEETYVKVISHEHARLMERIGATETVFPEHDSGVRLGRRIGNRLLLDYVEFGSGIGLQEMAVPSGWIGRSLRELALPRRAGITVVAVHDMLLDEVRTSPDPDAPLKDSDTLLVAGKIEDLRRADRLVAD